MPATAALASRQKQDHYDYGKSPNKRRQEAIEKAKAEAKYVESLMNKYDTNKSGKLEQDQLKLLLKDMSNGADPSDEEIRWVFYKADTSKGSRNFGVDSNELLYALRTWKGYLDNKEYLDATFEKYDTNKSGQLERDQLKNLMTDLCGEEEPPTDKEVSQVLYEADRKDGQVSGTLHKTELMYAISLWYNMLKERKVKKSSSMCTVM